MSPPTSSNSPSIVDIEEGKKYAWCSCGKSSKQPFCDGSHMGTGSRPVLFTAEATKKAYLCGCKATKSPPFCDGSHNALNK
jgi:CDGSH-type Zn-finger protein